MIRGHGPRQTFGRAISGVLGLVLFSGSAFGQEVLWETQSDLGGNDVPQAIVLTDKTVTVVGQADTPGNGFDVVLQSLSRSNGTVKQTVHDPLYLECWARSAAWRLVIGDLDNGCNTPSLVTRLHDTVFVATSVQGAPTSSDIRLRAYDVNSGAFLWEYIFGTGVDFDAPRAIAASNNAVAVVTVTGAVTGLDPSTGAMLWFDQVDSTLSSVAAERNQVFVSTGNELRAYRARSGALIWSVHLPADTRYIQALDGRLFVAGSRSQCCGPYLAVFDAKLGALLWETPQDLHSSDYFTRVAVHGHRIIAVGCDVCLNIPVIQNLVRAYDLETGELQWSATGPEPGYNIDIPVAVTLNEDTVYVVSTGNTEAWTDLIVRAYEADTGALRWVDHSHRVDCGPAGCHTGPVQAVDVALGANRLFVAAMVPGGLAVPGSLPPTDFLIRAYAVDPPRARDAIASTTAREE